MISPVSEPLNPKGCKHSEVGTFGGNCQAMPLREHSTHNRLSTRGLLGWGKGKEESGRVKDPISEDPTPSSELCGPKALTRYTYIFARKGLMCIKIF